MSQPTPPTNPTVAEIRIIFDGNLVSVSAPMENRMMCFGMLEMAKSIIEEQARKTAVPKITLPPSVPILGLVQ